MLWYGRRGGRGKGIETHNFCSAEKGRAVYMRKDSSNYPTSTEPTPAAGRSAGFVSSLEGVHSAGRAISFLVRPTS